MEILLQKVKEQGVNEEQRQKVYAYASRASQDMIDEVCPALYRVCLNSEKGALKNELGRVIFHLAKNDRLNTRIGLEKLLDACLIVKPAEMFKILATSGQDAKKLGEQIKSVF